MKADMNTQEMDERFIKSFGRLVEGIASLAALTDMTFVASIAIRPEGAKGYEAHHFTIGSKLVLKEQIEALGKSVDNLADDSEKSRFTLNQRVLHSSNRNGLELI